MAKTVEVTATAYVWNWIFPRLAAFELPESLGEGDGKDFDEIQRAIVKTECAEAVKEFKAFSHYAQQLGAKNRVIFGHKEDWKETESLPEAFGEEKSRKKKRKDFEHLNPEKSYTLKFNKDARSGLTWFFLTLLSPPVMIERMIGRNEKPVQIPSHDAATPIQAETFIWPIVKQLGREKAMREALGLDNSQKKRAWADDEDEGVPVPTKTGKGEEKLAEV
jgi:hypothetical protein